jgi:DNA phosphorothioation-dependent restriction protein DptH
MGEPISLIDNRRPTVIRLYATQNEALQKAMASFILLNIYQNIFLRGLQPTLTHAVIFDEAHRASRLRLIPTMAKECRKYGLSLILASQEARDFDRSLYSAIANYLVLRVTETDAKVLANNVASFSDAKNIAAKSEQKRLRHRRKLQPSGDGVQSTALTGGRFSLTKALILAVL